MRPPPDNFRRYQPKTQKARLAHFPAAGYPADTHPQWWRCAAEPSKTARCVNGSVRRSPGCPGYSHGPGIARPDRASRPAGPRHGPGPDCSHGYWHGQPLQELPHLPARRSAIVTRKSKCASYHSHNPPAGGDLIQIIKRINPTGFHIAHLVIVTRHGDATGIPNLIVSHPGYAGTEPGLEFQFHHRFNHAITVLVNGHHTGAANVAVNVGAEVIAVQHKIIHRGAAINHRAINALSKVAIGIQLRGPARHQALAGIQANNPHHLKSTKTTYTNRDGFELPRCNPLATVTANQRPTRQGNKQNGN